MLNKKIIIDLNDENENKNKNEKIQDTFDIGINFSDNNEENDTKEKKIDNNKEKQSEWKNKSNNFWLNTSLTWDENTTKNKVPDETTSHLVCLTWDENTTKNKDFIKQIAKQWVNVNKNIDDEVYNQILKKYKKKSKVKYIVITLFSFSIICAWLAYIFSTNNIVLTTIFRNKTNWNNKNTWYQIKYENLKKDITSYYDNKIIEKTKWFTKKTKENTLFKFDILKYEFNNKTIKFKQFNKQVNNLISSIK